MTKNEKVGTGVAVIGTGLLVWLLMRKKPVNAVCPTNLHFWAEPSIVTSGTHDWPSHDFNRPGQIYLTINNEQYQMTDQPYPIVPGAEINIEAFPYSTGVIFLNWIIDGQVISENPYIFRPTGSSFIIANFGYGG